METMDISQAETSVEKTDNSNYSEKLIEREEIINTPFILVRDEKGYFLTMGKYRITERESKEELLRKVEEKDWELMTTIIGVVTQATNEILNGN